MISEVLHHQLRLKVDGERAESGSAMVGNRVMANESRNKGALWLGTSEGESQREVFRETEAAGATARDGM